MLTGPRILWVLIGLIGGCAGTRFTEADRQQMKTVELGSTFGIVLPSGGHDWAPPVLKGASVQFLRREAEDSGETMVFSFQANREGESEIFIPARPARGSDLDFTMRVLVIEPDDAGDSVLDEDWRERWRESRHARDD